MFVYIYTLYKCKSIYVYVQYEAKYGNYGFFLCIIDH